MSACTISMMSFFVSMAQTCVAMMLATSMPFGRVILSTRLVTMNTAFTITASVNAICTATSTAPVLLRSIALSIGRNSMNVSSLCLQEGRGRHAADAPGRVQPGREARRERDREAGGEHVEIEMRVALGLLQHRLHAAQAHPREQEAEQSAREADDADLDEMLAEDRRARRTERPAQADLRCLADELGEQQAD